MIVAAQMIHAVGCQESKLTADTVAVFRCLFPDTMGIDHDVAQLQ